MFNLGLLFVALVWGINFSIIKYALEDFDPLGFTVVRFALAALFLVFLMLANRESLYVERRDRVAVVKLGFLGITLYSIFFMHGLTRTTATNSALLISLSPLFGALIQAASGRERLASRMSVGLGLASVGAFFVITGRHGGVSFSSSAVLGDLLTLCATTAWAFYTITAKPLLEKYSAVKVTAFSMATGCVLLLPVAMSGLLRQSWAVSMGSWSALFFSAFIAGGVAYSLWYQGVKKIGATRTMAYHYLMPVAAVIFAALFLGERIALLQIIGGAAILIGVYLTQGNAVKPKVGG